MYRGLFILGTRPEAIKLAPLVLGMRERAAMLGGDLTAGPTTDGGYQVSAALPLREEPT